MPVIARDRLIDLTDEPWIADNLAGLSEDEMAERIPSHIFLARGVEVGTGKYQALFSAPGLIPGVHKNPDGTPALFNTEREAEIAAMRALIGVLNKPRANARRNQGKPERYQKMTSTEFAVALQTNRLTPSFFAYLYGTSQDRVLKWIDGVDAVPHPARILLALFDKDQTNVDLAEEVTDSVTESRNPGKSG